MIFVGPDGQGPCSVPGRAGRSAIAGGQERDILSFS